MVNSWTYAKPAQGHNPWGISPIEWEQSPKSAHTMFIN